MLTAIERRKRLRIMNMIELRRFKATVTLRFGYLSTFLMCNYYYNNVHYSMPYILLFLLFYDLTFIYIFLIVFGFRSLLIVVFVSFTAAIKCSNFHRVHGTKTGVGT